jgi:hypothetical protein
MSTKNYVSQAKELLNHYEGWEGLPPENERPRSKAVNLAIANVLLAIEEHLKSIAIDIDTLTNRER